MTYLFVSDLREAEGKSYLSPHEALGNASGPILCLLKGQGGLRLAVDVERTLRELACHIAEDVLPIFEKKFPEDRRPRKAIETARRYNAGQATREELAAARETARELDAATALDAARGAALAITREAAWAMALATTREAAWAAARDAAWAAAWAASWDTAWDKYNRWIDEALLAIIERIPEELAFAYLIADLPLKEGEIWAIEH